MILLVLVRRYRQSDEREYLICRFLSFLDSPFWDDIERKKPEYKKSVELVAEEPGKGIVGVLDVEVESEPGEICSNNQEISAQIMTLGVLPEFRGLGIATQMLSHAEVKLSDMGINRLEAWTRDDSTASNWYTRKGFSPFNQYRHVYLSRNDKLSAMFPKGLTPIQVFLHVTNPDNSLDEFLVDRCYECIGYEKNLSNS